MKSICLSLAAAATIGLAIAVPVTDAAARTPGGAPAVRAPAAPVAPPRIVVPNKTVQLPPTQAKPAAGGALAGNNRTKKGRLHCYSSEACYWLNVLCTRDGGGMSSNPDNGPNGATCSL